MRYDFHEQDKQTLILTADPDINTSRAEEMAGELEGIIERGTRRIIVDCKQVAYVSTVGIGLLLLLHKRLAERGSDIKLANVHGLLSDILKTLRLDKVFDIHSDVEDARLAYAQSN